MPDNVSNMLDNVSRLQHASIMALAGIGRKLSRVSPSSVQERALEESNQASIDSTRLQTEMRSHLPRLPAGQMTVAASDIINICSLSVCPLFLSYCSCRGELYVPDGIAKCLLLPCDCQPWYNPWWLTGLKTPP